MKRVRVKCIIYVEVELEDDDDEIFVIEENGCPGTGVVGAALNKFMEENWESSYCLMCANQCVNVIDKILERGTG